ncbi:MAG: ABC transporter permease [Gammaproteobacteria bacterium]
MPEYPISPLRASGAFLRARDLIATLIWRDVIARYRGSLIGLFWSWLNPLFSLAMYTFVFAVVFKARWGLHAETTGDFALILFAGLIVHALLADCMIAAPGLILGNPAYVKQLVFPLEILSLVSVGASIFHAAISLALLLLVWFITHGELPASIVFIPLLWLPLCVIAAGFSWLLAASAVYIPDIAQIVGFLSKALLFFSPIFYPAGAVPEPFRALLNVNPLTYVIETTRTCLILGEWPELDGYLVYCLISLTLAWIGFVFFQKLRPGFADVL